MKKLSFLAVAALLAFGLSSCDKEYTCKCKADPSGAEATYTIKGKKNKATDECKAHNVSSGGVTVTCELDNDD